MPVPADFPYPLDQNVDVPLEQIRPNPKQPRRLITQDMIQTRAASMGQGGQANPILLRPLTPEEKVQEPDPKVLLEIVDGEVRYRAASFRGDKTIKSEIRDLTFQQARQISKKANLGFKPAWIETYLNIAEDYYGYPDPPYGVQKTLAEFYEVDPAYISRALKLVPLLTPKSQDLILEQFKTEQGTWQITERPAYALADLGDAQTIEKAIPVVIERQFTENQVKNYVAWIKAGNRPEDYKKAAHSSQPTVDRKTPTVSPLNPQPNPAAPTATIPVVTPVSPTIETPKVSDNPQPFDVALGGVDSKQNNQKTKQPSGAEALDGLKKAGKEAKEEMKAKVAQVKATIPAGQKPQLKHILAILGHWAWIGTKFAFKCLKHIAKWVVKRVHHDSGYMAKQLVPRHGKTSFGDNLINLLLRGAVYLVSTLAMYGLPLGLIASVFGGWHWIYSAGMGLAHLVFIQWPLGLVNSSLHQPLVLLGLFTVAYLALLKAFKPGLGSSFILAVLLFAVWLFRGMWMPFIPMAINFVSEHATTGTSNPTQRHEDTKNGQGLSVLISKSDMDTPVPNPQGEEHALGVPIPEQGMGTSVPTAVPVVTRRQQPKTVRKTPNSSLQTSNSLKQAVPVAIVSAQNSTPKTENAAPSGQSQLDLINQINAESKTAQAFAQAFYAADYNDLLGRRTKLNKYLSPGYSGDFFKAFPIALKIKEIGEHKLVEGFKPSGDAKLLRSDDQSEEFQVEGTLVTRSEMDISEPVTTQKPAGLVIDLSREPESKGLVTGVREMDFSGKKGSP